MYYSISILALYNRASMHEKKNENWYMTVYNLSILR